MKKKHPLVVALDRLDMPQRRAVEWYLRLKKADVLLQMRRVQSTDWRRRHNDTEYAGTQLFLQMDELRRRKRRFRKVVRRFTKSYGPNYPRDEVFWHMIAHQLAVYSQKEMKRYIKERRKRWNRW